MSAGRGHSEGSGGGGKGDGNVSLARHLLEGLLLPFVAAVWVATGLWGYSTWCNRNLLFVRIRRPLWLYLDLIQTGLLVAIIAANEALHIQHVVVPCRVKSLAAVLFIVSCPAALLGRGVQLWHASLSMEYNSARNTVRLQMVNKKARIAVIVPLAAAGFSVAISVSHVPLCLGPHQLCQTECYWGSQYLLLLPLALLIHADVGLVWWFLRSTRQVERTGIQVEMQRFTFYSCFLVCLGLAFAILMDAGIMEQHPGHTLCSLCWMLAITAKFVIIHCIPSFNFGYAPTCRLRLCCCRCNAISNYFSNSSKVTPIISPAATRTAYSYESVEGIQRALYDARARRGVASGGRGHSSQVGVLATTADPPGQLRGGDEEEDGHGGSERLSSFHWHSSQQEDNIASRSSIASVGSSSQFAGGSSSSRRSSTRSSSASSAASTSSGTRYSFSRPSGQRSSVATVDDARNSMPQPPLLPYIPLSDMTIEDVFEREATTLLDFRAFCRSLACDHMLLFVLTLRPYQAHEGQPIPRVLPEETLLSIYRTYIHPGSSQCVPLPPQLSRAIREFCQPTAGLAKALQIRLVTIQEEQGGKSGDGSASVSVNGSGGDTSMAKAEKRSSALNSSVRLTRSSSSSSNSTSSARSSGVSNVQHPPPLPADPQASMSTINMLMELAYLEILTLLAEEALPMFKTFMAYTQSMSPLGFEPADCVSHTRKEGGDYSSFSGGSTSFEAFHPEDEEEGEDEEWQQQQEQQQQQQQQQQASSSSSDRAVIATSSPPATGEAISTINMGTG